MVQSVSGGRKLDAKFAVQSNTPMERCGCRWHELRSSMDIPIRTGVEVKDVEPPEFPYFYGVVLPIGAVVGISANLACVAVSGARSR